MIYAIPVLSPYLSYFTKLKFSNNIESAFKMLSKDQFLSGERGVFSRDLTPGPKISRFLLDQRPYHFFSKQALGFSNHPSLKIWVATLGRAGRGAHTYSVDVVCQHMHSPMDSDFTAVKCILRYIKGSLSQGLLFTEGSLHLSAFANADWEGDSIDRRSAGGYCVFL